MEEIEEENYDENDEALLVANSYGVKQDEGIRLLYYFTDELLHTESNLTYEGKSYNSVYLGIAYMVNRHNTSYPLQFAYCFRIQLELKDKPIPFRICFARTSSEEKIYLNDIPCYHDSHFFDVFLYSTIWRLPWYCSYKGLNNRIVFAQRSTDEILPRLVIPFVGSKICDLNAEQIAECSSLTNYEAPPTFFFKRVEDRRRGNAFGLLVPFKYMKKKQWKLSEYIDLYFQHYITIRVPEQQTKSRKVSNPLDPPILDDNLNLYGYFLTEDSSHVRRGDADFVKPTRLKRDRKVVYINYWNLVCEKPQKIQSTTDVKDIEWKISNSNTVYINPANFIVLYHMYT